MYDGWMMDQIHISIYSTYCLQLFLYFDSILRMVEIKTTTKNNKSSYDNHIATKTKKQKQFVFLCAIDYC